MEEIVQTAIQGLLKLGPTAIPWVVLLVVCVAFYLVVKAVLTQLFETQAVVIELLREGAEADKQMAVEYRRLVDVVQNGRRR